MIDKDQRRAQAAFSLVEIIIALSIAGFLLAGAVYFSKNAAESKAITKNREMARKTNESLLALLKRDFDYQNSFALSNGRFQFTLNRKDSYKKDAAIGNFSVSYTDACVPIQGTNLAKVNALKKVYAKDHSAEYAKAAGHCLADLKCKPDTFPQLKIKPDASSVHYATTDFPLASHESSALTDNQSIGTAACFNVVNGSLHVFVESVYISNPSLSSLSVFSDEVILSSSDFSNVEVLPK